MSDVTPSKLLNPPSLIKYGPLSFLVMDAPSDVTLPLYLKELEKNNVKDVVRVCEGTYSKEKLESLGIKVHDWSFSDGEAPPANIVDDWLALVESRFGSLTEGKKAIKAEAKAGNTNIKQNANSAEVCVAIHCVAGLGRAPVLVAIALIEMGMSPLDAVVFIRERRRGAINNRQIKYLEGYKKRSKSGSCIIM